MRREEIVELINRRRRQILVHSCRYYRMNENIIGDHTYDRWSKELAELQREHPEAARECVYAEDFETFDGSSGFDLPHGDPRVLSKAAQLLRIHRGRA